MAEGKVLDKEETLEKILNNTDYTELLQNKKSVKKEKRICALPAMAAMLTGKNGMQIL